jgi:hypothetical protein
MHARMQCGLGIKTNADCRPALAPDGLEGARRELVGPGETSTNRQRAGKAGGEEKRERADESAAGKRGSSSRGRSRNLKDPRRFAHTFTARARTYLTKYCRQQWPAMRRAPRPHAHQKETPAPAGERLWRHVTNQILLDGRPQPTKSRFLQTQRR